MADDEGDDGDAHQDDPGQAEQQERLGKRTCVPDGSQAVAIFALVSKECK